VLHVVDVGDDGAKRDADLRSCQPDAGGRVQRRDQVFDQLAGIGVDTMDLLGFLPQDGISLGSKRHDGANCH
jgi:hypothetical protein